MQEGTLMGLVPISPLVLMIAAMCTNRWITVQRIERKAAQEAATFRAGLKAEIKALIELYRTNIDLLQSQAGYILSTRAAVLLYRANLGRLPTLLDETLIAQMVSAFAKTEQIEAFAAAYFAAKGASVYKTNGDTEAEGKMRTMFAENLPRLIRSAKMIERYVGAPSWPSFAAASVRNVLPKSAPVPALQPTR